MESRRRATLFACSAILIDKLISKEVEAENISKAKDIFFKEFKINPEIILGPFYKKKNKVSLKNGIKFDPSGEVKKFIFGDWVVSGIMLFYPENHVYCVFENRIDLRELKKPKPKIINIKELKDLGEIK